MGGCQNYGSDLGVSPKLKTLGSSTHKQGLPMQDDEAPQKDSSASVSCLSGCDFLGFGFGV